MEHKRSELYTAAKIIATFYVVVAHAAVMYTPLGVYDPVRASAPMAMLSDFFYSFHMPLFFCLSGCVYACCVEAENIGTYLHMSATKQSGFCSHISQPESVMWRPLWFCWELRETDTGII